MTLTIEDVKARLEADGHKITDVEVVHRTDGIAPWYEPGIDLRNKKSEDGRILIFTPLHPVYGIKEQTVQSVRAIINEYDKPVDWLLAANDNISDKPYENVVNHHNRARQIILEQDYEAMLSIEADMILPPDTANRLMAIDADIVYGLYVWRHKPRRWSAYKTLNLWGGESFSFNHEGHDAREAWGKVKDVAGLGMGCTLIRRNVLEAINFRIHDGNPGWIVDEYKEQFETLGINPYRPHPHMVCDDWLLAMDAQHYGFSQKADCGLICGHIFQDEVLWPDIDADKFYRIDSLRS